MLFGYTQILVRNFYSHNIKTIFINKKEKTGEQNWTTGNCSKVRQDRKLMGLKSHHDHVTIVWQLPKNLPKIMLMEILSYSPTKDKRMLRIDGEAIKLSSFGNKCNQAIVSQRSWKDVVSWSPSDKTFPLKEFFLTSSNFFK